MRDIHASAEVKELAGLDTLRELEGDAFECYDGWRCGGPGRTTDPVTVVVLSYQSTAIVKFAHARCAESQVVGLPVDRPAELEAFGLSDMISKGAVVEYATAPRWRAVLVPGPGARPGSGQVIP
jgi:hypothetical protein